MASLLISIFSVLSFVLLARASMLSKSREHYWATKIKEGWKNAVERANFCKGFGLLCEDNVPIIVQDDGFYYYCPPCLQKLPKNPGHFFKKSDLLVGKTISMDNLDKKLPPRSFLPQAISHELAVKTENVGKILKTFGITEGSNMSINIENAAEMCTLSPEDGNNLCASSAAALMDFVRKKLNTSSVRALYTLPPRGIQSQVELSISKVTKVKGADEPNVVCHSMMSPFRLYFCHVLPESEVYKVGLENEDIGTVDVIATCHGDTSSWGAEHPAFKMLNMKPGEGAICHWVRGSDIVWVAV